MYEPPVSILMNCYNGEKFLREAVESVLGQTYRNWELIFWDNQSSDESAVIFNSYADKRFHYYWAPEHTVLGQARNLAVEQARGEWVAFLDCDDVWLPEKLHKQVAIIREESVNLGLVYGYSQILVEEGKGDANIVDADGNTPLAISKKKIEFETIFGNLWGYNHILVKISEFLNFFSQKCSIFNIFIL